MEGVGRGRADAGGESCPVPRVSPPPVATKSSAQDGSGTSGSAREAALQTASEHSLSPVLQPPRCWAPFWLQGLESVPVQMNSSLVSFWDAPERQMQGLREKFSEDMGKNVEILGAQCSGSRWRCSILYEVGVVPRTLPHGYGEGLMVAKSTSSPDSEP